MECRAADGSRLVFDVHGEGAAVVLLHGLIGSADSWRFQAGPLSAGNRLLIPDARGMGRSESRSGGYSMDVLVDDVVRMLDATSTEAATLVGLSMGGGVAQATALAHPERVEGLVLVSTSPSFSEPTRRRFLAEADAVERGGVADWVEVWLARWFSEGFRQQRHDVVARERAQILATDPMWFAARARVNAERSFEHDLHRLKAPVTYIGGAIDPMDCATHIARYRAVVPDFSAELIDGASHSVHIEAPDRFNALVATNLKRRRL